MEIETHDYCHKGKSKIFRKFHSSKSSNFKKRKLIKTFHPPHPKFLCTTYLRLREIKQSRIRKSPSNPRKKRERKIQKKFHSPLPRIESLGGGREQRFPVGLSSSVGITNRISRARDTVASVIEHTGHLTEGGGSAPFNARAFAPNLCAVPCSLIRIKLILRRNELKGFAIGHVVYGRTLVAVHEDTAPDVATNQFDLFRFVSSSKSN